MTLPTTCSSRSVLEPGVQGRPADLRDGRYVTLGQPGCNALTSQLAQGQGLGFGLLGVFASVGGVEGELSADFVGVHVESVKHLTTGVDGRKVVYMATEYTEDEFYAHIVATVDQSADPGHALLENTPLMNFVGTQREWIRAKAALLRWIAEKDDEYDELARDQEHEDPDD